MSLTSNKLVVTAAIDAVLGARDLDAIDRFFAADYIQHSATGAEGPGALRELLGGMPDEFRYERVRIIGDGDLVACHGVYYGAEDWPLAGFDVFRIEDGKLAEHWDNHQRFTGPAMLDGPSDVALPGQTELTRAVVNPFLDDVLAGGPLIEPAWIEPAWIEHSPGWTGRGYRRRHFTVAEGEFALTGSSGASSAGDDVRYDLFRVADGQIAEHWAVISPVPSVIKHDNGLF